MRNLALAVLIGALLLPASGVAVTPPLPDDLKPAPFKPQAELKALQEEFDTLKDEAGLLRHLARAEDLLAKHPDWIDLHRHYIGVTRLARKWPEVQAKYQEQAAADSANAILQFTLGLFEAPQKAETHFRKALEIDPNQFHARCALGLTLMQGPMPREAEAFPLLFEAAHLRPDHPYAYQALALAYEMGKDLETSIKVREMARKVEPNSFTPVQHIASSLEKLGRGTEGIDLVAAFVKEHPKDKRARKFLVETYKKTGKEAEAAREQITLAETAADDPAEAYNAAKILAAKDPGAAKQWLGKAVERGFDNYREMEKDGELSALRSDPEFPSFVDRAKKAREKGAGPRKSALLASLQNKPAPLFEATTLDSAKVSLEGLRGKVVVLDFWATWCGPCRMTLPLVRDLHASVKGKPVEILCMNVWEKDKDRAKVAPYWKENQYPMTVALASADDAKAYGVSGIPTLFIVDQRGQIRYSHVGYDPYMDEEVGWIIDSLIREGDQGEVLR